MDADKNTVKALLVNAVLGEKLTSYAQELLWTAFRWSATTQGFNYWHNLANYEAHFNEEYKTALEEMLKED